MRKDSHNKFYNALPSTVFIINMVDDYHYCRENLRITKGKEKVPFFSNISNEFFKNSMNENNIDKSEPGGCCTRINVGNKVPVSKCCSM